MPSAARCALACTIGYGTSIKGASTDIGTPGLKLWHSFSSGVPMSVQHLRYYVKAGGRVEGDMQHGEVYRLSSMEVGKTYGALCMVYIM